VLEGNAVTTVPAPEFKPASPPGALVCPGKTATFSFPAGASSQAVKRITSNGTDCALAAEGGGFNITCGAVAAPGKAVALTAFYGGDSACSSAAEVVTLAVEEYPQITATIVAAPDDVCPGALGALSFEVTPSAPVASLTGRLVSVAAGGDAAPAQADCAATGGGAAWTVACSGLAAGSYALAVEMTSPEGERALGGNWGMWGGVEGMDVRRWQRGLL
jgi:hypothetical protein